MTFDWNASFEWLAEQFYRETGLMAPGKDDPFNGDNEVRKKAWNEWFTVRSEQAWREWHEKHGMLRAATDSYDRNAVIEAARVVVREELDAVSVHPCDEHNDGVRAVGLSKHMRKLYLAISAQPEGK